MSFSDLGQCLIHEMVRQVHAFLAESFHHRTGRGDPSLLLGINHHPDGSLVRNAQRRGTIPCRQIIQDHAAAGIRQGISKHGAFSGMEAARRYGRGSRSWIHRSQPSRLGQSLDRRIGRTAALNFQGGRFRDNYRCAELSKQINQSYLR